MLRNSWPYDTANTSDVELAAWTNRVIGQNFTALGNGSSIAKVCEVCMDELCSIAAFPGNPDLTGVGVSQFYYFKGFLHCSSNRI